VIPARFLSVKLGTFTITAVSLFFALLLLIMVYRGRLIAALRVISCKTMCLLFLQALFGMVLFRMFLIIGMIRTSAGEAGILTGAAPAITAILAATALKESLNIKKMIGIIFTVGGIFLIQGLLITKSGFSTEHFTGNMLVLCAASCESLFNILSRIFARHSVLTDEKNEIISGSQEINKLHPAVQTAMVSAIAMMLCLIPASLEHPVAKLAAIGPAEWFALVWYGFFVTALAFNFWYAGIRRCSAVTAAAFSGMMPFTSLLLSVVLLGEHAGLGQWTGGILVIMGIIRIGCSETVSESKLFRGQ
jgi:drug/metabolite transporter (DMT)-like permease